MAKFQDEVFSKCLLQFLLSITTNNQTKNMSCTSSIPILFLFFHINPSVLKQSSAHNKPCIQHPQSEINWTRFTAHKCNENEQRN